MKRKTPFTSSVKNKSKSRSTQHIEDSSSDDQSSKQVMEDNLDEQSNEKEVEKKQTIWDQITRKQFISAVKELGSDKKQLDEETWRFNDFTRSKESIWSRLISKLKLNQTENIRQSLYNVWRRNRQKSADVLFESHQDSVEKVHKSDKENKVELLLPKSVNKSTASDESSPHAQTRSTVEQESNTSTIVEASFILTLKDWKDIYNSSTRKMVPGWTDMMSEKVRSCNFRCTLALKNHHVSLEESHKINSSFSHCIATCKTPSCKRTFEVFIRDEPIYRDSIVVHIRAGGDEDHSADEKAIVRHLTGKARLEVGKAASAIGCLKVLQQKVENADEEMLSARNFTGCESMEVIKHAAADYRKKFQLDEDIFR
ncbi:unnamed protein product [Rotaria sp. Silwood2]|nr:unnamed protein product [Rotaria sp. Silwood2]CAF4376893.1 unnamed protein product [Rotaria sp. Silwood2]